MHVTSTRMLLPLHGVHKFVKNIYLLIRSTGTTMKHICGRILNLEGCLLIFIDNEDSLSGFASFDILHTWAPEEKKVSITCAFHTVETFAYSSFILLFKLRHQFGIYALTSGGEKMLKPNLQFVQGKDR